MSKKTTDRFTFLDEVATEPTPAASTPVTDQAEQSRPYLYQTHSRTEALAPLGNRVRLPAKHALEDYVRDLKRAGHPATEARVLEAMMFLLEQDKTVRDTLTVYLTGKSD